MSAHITLGEMLHARDVRRERELQLLKAHPDCALVVITVNIPGNVKRTRCSVDIGYEALRVVIENLGRPVDLEVYDRNTGFEAFAVMPMDAVRAKGLCIDIERRHPLGRIFDLDVIAPDGKPVSRRVKGAPIRKCLLCDEDARVCMRLRTHSTQELIDKISAMHHEFFHTL